MQALILVKKSSSEAAYYNLIDYGISPHLNSFFLTLQLKISISYVFFLSLKYFH